MKTLSNLLIIALTIVAMEAYQFYHGWVPVPPRCVQRYPGHKCIVQGKMTPEFARAYASFLATHTNPAAVRLVGGNEVEIRTALLFHIAADLYRYAAGAVLESRGEMGSAEFQRVTVFCDDVARHMLLDEDQEPFDLTRPGLLWSTYVSVMRPSYAELDDLVESY